jgi:proton glutamate symport protein
VDTIPDVFATLGNVTGDLTATSVVAKQSRSSAPSTDEVRGIEPGRTDS